MNEQQVARPLMLDLGLKAKWLEALRGGRYRQAQGVLQNPQGGHCCIGVLADITDRSKWSSKLMDSEQAEQQCYFYDGDDTMIQPGSLAELGLSIDTAVKLAGMNDDGISFEEIANWIEANL